MGETPSIALLVSSWELFRDPILVGAMAGAALGYLGVFIVLRRMVFVSAALSQAAGLGVGLAFFAQIHWKLPAAMADPLAWAVGLTLLATWALSWNGGRLITREGLLALFYLVGGSGAMLIGTRISQEAHDIQAILFGTGVLVGPSDTAWVLAVGGVVLLVQLWFRRGMLFASLDPEGARVRALPTRLLDATLMISVAVLASVSTRALGALPVFAFSVLPALAAVAVSRSPGMALVLATVIGLVSGAGGYLLAFFAEFPVGASQTFVAALAVVVGLVVGALARR
jgi:zinc transport system permease protein